MNGILYVAYGDRAKDELRYSLEALRRQNDYPVAVISDEAVEGWIEWHEPGKGARWAKLNCYNLSPFERTLYLDADTRANENLSVGFDILADGWDLVIVPSENQGKDILWHIGAEEKERTIQEIGFEAVQLQGGVFWFGKNERTEQLFTAWQEEWKRWGDQDQAALMRALYRNPVKLWLLGHSWNGGACIQHLFGRTRR